MKLTYMLSPTTPYITHSQASNILSENLKRDERIDITFNLSILSLNMRILKEKNILIENMEDNPFETVYKKPQMSQNFLRILGGMCSNTKEFLSHVDSTIKTDIVLITCWTIHSIPLIAYLLNSGRKVVMGGSFCNAYPTDFIRSLVPESNIENLVIVRGYVGVETDLYKIITDWKDVEIPKTDYVDMWTANGDHMKGYLNLLSKCRGLDNTFYSVTFNNNCWYNKCKFCKLRDEKQPDFIRNIDVDSLYENLIINLKSYKSKNILINDNYFIFNDKNKTILQRLRRDGYKIQVLSGIISFNSKSYLEDINEYVDGVSCGLESTVDFSLDYITKGYRWDDIKRSMENMNKYLDRDKNIRYLAIFDLVSKDQRDIVQNYTNMLSMRNTLYDYGFEKVGFSATPLQLFPSVGLIEDTDHLKIRNSNNVSGMWYAYNYLSKFDLEANMSFDHMMPFERYDINGNLLLSDFEYVSSEVMNGIF